MALTTLLSAAALTTALLALTKSATASTYTAAQRAAAKTTMCDRYKLAARSVGIETKIPDNTALARISLTNGAVMLETAAMDPALDTDARTDVRALALAYQDLTVMGTNGVAGEAQFQAAMDAVNDKDRVMKELCGD
ncbi:hypothetical protein AWC28_20990 [Mycolicibacter terrae]|jgi:hypothetical protein|nr:hypothetical protein AWC28_20905 [Mycolicibacter terrae]ORW89229.1 hypothetical protein AWC28_20990 [Mycolicibacter terrae]